MKRNRKTKEKRSEKHNEHEPAKETLLPEEIHPELTEYTKVLAQCMAILMHNKHGA